RAGDHASRRARRLHRRAALGAALLGGGGGGAVPRGAARARRVAPARHAVEVVHRGAPRDGGARAATAWHTWTSGSRRARVARALTPRPRAASFAVTMNAFGFVLHRHHAHHHGPDGSRRRRVHGI